MGFKTKWLLAVVVIIGIIMPMVIKGPDGEPVMDLSDWLPGAVNDSVQSVSEQFEGEERPVVLSSRSGKMYKWQDEKGVWHFSAEKPVDDQNADIEQLPEVQNVMDAPVESDNDSSTIRLPGGFSL